MLKAQIAKSSGMFIKVCGLTRSEEVAACLNMGIDATGFIFVPGSPREISQDEARALPRGAALRVGVFAKSSAARVLQIADRAGLDYVQLHGGESTAYCKAIGPERIIKTIWPETMSAGGRRSCAASVYASSSAFLRP